MDTLKDSARALGVELDDAQVRAFRVYADELLAWNAKFNLTAITDRAEIDRKHFLDSLSALTVFQPPTSNLHVLDVGAGAGFPAIPLKLVCPNWRVTLLEATRKKCDFLEHLLIVLHLRDTRVIWGRAETAGRTHPASSKVPASLDAGTAVPPPLTHSATLRDAAASTRGGSTGGRGPAGHQPAEREQYDLVVARAVAELNVLAEFMLPFARVGGHCIAWKGEVEEEVRAAQRAIEKLGGRLSAVHAVQVPGIDAKRNLVVIEKVSSSPAAYPRREGVPSKKPLQ